MHQIAGQIMLTPTDVTKHLACAHITTLDRLSLAPSSAGSPDGPRPAAPDDALDLVFRKGMEHERAYLQSLRSRGREIVSVAAPSDPASRRAASQQTISAMRAGADVIYQAAFLDGSWAGQADFLLRRETPSALGPWSYDVADTKLARRLQVPALLQLATYAEALTSLQGVPPQHLIVVSGDGDEQLWRLADVESYARRCRQRLQKFLAARPPTEPVPVPHCRQCRWADTCTDVWQRADDLSLVASMRRPWREVLQVAGVSTLATLAESDPATLPSAIGQSSRQRLTQQARLQLNERRTGQPSYALLPPTPGRGLLALPTPSPGDVYLDFEGDPYAEGGAGREYLAGLGDVDDAYFALWAHDAEAEKRLTEDLLDDLLRRWQRDPDMHIYHYAPYEITALQRMTARHGTREAELDRLLRDERFVDLYSVVRQGLRISKPSYSIKYLEDFYWPGDRKDDAVASGIGSVVAYEQWLLERDPTILDDLAHYNCVDVRSTRALQLWLEERRAELEQESGPQPRRQRRGEEVGRPISDEELAEAALADRALAADHSLLAGLISWHRRESRPRWWDVFRLDKLDDEQLVRDSSALGLLGPPTEMRVEKRSVLWHYPFPPQDTKLGLGPVWDVDTHKPVGELFELRPDAGELLLKVGKGRTPPAPRGLATPGPVNDAVLRASVAKVATGILAGRHPLGAALLARTTPPGPRRRSDESAQETVVRVGRGLHDTVLAVQGPPGSGKTTTGAQLIRALLDDGKKVGVTATSHAVIGNLLAAVGRPALQLCSEEQSCGAPLVAVANNNADVDAALAAGDANLVGGTAWLWSRPDAERSVDVLVLDEAGQFSLANAVAVSAAARGLILLGDPQQLAQPSQAQHPYGAGVSALDHLLDGASTIPADRGIFLDTTWRMHPDITAFVSERSYEGRLSSGPHLDRQRIDSSGRLTGSGLRFVPVHHEGNSSASREETAIVSQLVDELIGATFHDSGGQARPLTIDDVLIVAPYNNQVARLRRALPTGARVGTVDRFQGQQAPVVLYSMASSSAGDAPRGIDFLYDLNRLNVAVSRAQALVTIVASPTLLDAPVRTASQLRLVNALCAYVEQATTV